MLKLQFLLSRVEDQPRRCKVDWRKSRQTKIGGSEVAGALGRSPYESKDDVVASKRLDRRRVSAACVFGRIFERIGRYVIQDAEGVIIHKVGALPSTRYPVCYSSDGVIVDGDRLKLVEIKCPYKRSRIERVPEHYRIQVLTGMEIMPCDVAVFYQFRFRICRITDIGPSPNYNRGMHTEGYTRCPSVRPIRWGYLLFKWPKRLDLGALTSTTDDLICDFRRKKAEVVFEKRRVPPTGAVLGWKLFDMTKVEVPREPGFLDRNAESLWRTHSDLVG